MMALVGLDFGTATTLVAAADGVILPLGDITPWLPSGVRVAGDAVLADDESGGVGDPGVVRSLKRAITERRATVTADGGAEVDADRAIRAVLAEALNRATRRGLELTADTAVRLGCPATWDRAQRHRLLGLAGQAGWPVGLGAEVGGGAPAGADGAGRAAGAALVDEPVAAGVAWLAHPAGPQCPPRCPAHIDGPSWMLVFDMGGGTLDVAVLRVDGPADVSVLASLGSAMAGDLLDLAIARDLAGELGQVDGDQVNGDQVNGDQVNGGPADGQLARALLERAGREAKERLSLVPEHPLVLPRILGHPGVIRYTRDRLARAFQPHLDAAQRLLATVVRVAAFADPAFERVDVALLTGGMSRVPPLAAWLAGEVPAATVVTDPGRGPEEAVVAGLAHARGLAGVNHLRPGFDVVLSHPAGQVSLYEAYTPIFEPLAGLAPGYQRRVDDLPGSGPASLRVRDVNGRVLALRLDSGATLSEVPVALGPGGITLFIGTDTTMVVTDGTGAAWSLELA